MINSFKKILIPDGDPDHHQCQIISSLCHCQCFLKISTKSTCNPSSYFGKNEIHTLPNTCCQKHSLLHGSNQSLVFIEESEIIHRQEFRDSRASFCPGIARNNGEKKYHPRMVLYHLPKWNSSVMLLSPLLSLL